MTVSVASSAGEDEVAGTAEPVRLRLVGVVAAVGSFDTLTGRGFPNVVALTPAFFRAHRKAANTDDDTMSVALRHGELDLPAFYDEIDRRGIHLAAPPQPASVYTADVQAVNRVPSGHAVGGGRTRGGGWSRDCRPSPGPRGADTS